MSFIAEWGLPQAKDDSQIVEATANAAISGEMMFNAHAHRARPDLSAIVTIENQAPGLKCAESGATGYDEHLFRWMFFNRAHASKANRRGTR